MEACKRQQKHSTEPRSRRKPSLKLIAPPRTPKTIIDFYAKKQESDSADLPLSNIFTSASDSILPTPECPQSSDSLCTASLESDSNALMTKSILFDLLDSILVDKMHPILGTSHASSIQTAAAEALDSSVDSKTVAVPKRKIDVEDVQAAQFQLKPSLELDVLHAHKFVLFFSQFSRSKPPQWHSTTLPDPCSSPGNEFPKLPLYLKYKHLKSKSTSSTALLPLPPHYLMLANMFSALESVCVFMTGRGQDFDLIFHKIKKAVSNICDR